MLQVILYIAFGFMLGLFTGTKGLYYLRSFVSAKNRVYVTAEERELLLK